MAYKGANENLNILGYVKACCTLKKTHSTCFFKRRRHIGSVTSTWHLLTGKFRYRDFLFEFEFSKLVPILVSFMHYNKGAGSM